MNTTEERTLKWLNDNIDFFARYRENPINANRTAAYDEWIERQRTAISAIETCRQLKKSLFGKENVTNDGLVRMVLQLKSGRWMPKKGGRSMYETPKCPYCGDKMILHISPHKYHAALTSAWYQCVTCDSASPRIEFPISCATSKIEETTLAVTLRRAEPKNRVLTLEEVEAYCEGGADATPLWYDRKDYSDASRWMMIDLPELAFGSTATVKRLVNSEFFGATYGTKWRCWLRKPTKEEMEAALWEE